MTTPTNFYNISWVIEDLSNSTLVNLDDFKKIKESNLSSKITNIDYVYMYSIILDMGKILAVGGNDKSGLSALEEIYPDDFKEKERISKIQEDFKTRISQIQENYKDIISKLKNNRNRIIAHVDISEDNSYFKLGFSKIEIEEKINNHKKYLRLINKDETDLDTAYYAKLNSLVPSSIKDERYCPSDFLNDIESFKKIITEVLGVARDLNFYFYNERVAQAPSKC